MQSDGDSCRGHSVRLAKPIQVIGFLAGLPVLFLTRPARDQPSGSANHTEIAASGWPSGDASVQVFRQTPHPRSEPRSDLGPARIENPLTKLLADRTLRPGDIVVFPDGPRVFKGRVGTHHAISDFARLSASEIAGPITALRVGVNDAWSSDAEPKTRSVTENGRESMPRLGDDDCRVRVRSPGHAVRCYRLAEH